MAALTHKGSVVGASSTTGDSVGYKNTDSGLQSTNVQDAIDEIIDGLGSASNKDVAVSGDASATQVVMGNDSRLSDARPASDVSAWAKADTKPSYTAAEVGAIATTAKGANGGVAELDSTGKVPASQLPLGETSSTAYAGNKGKANADAIAAIKDGSTIDSFSDVETALSGKQDKTDNALTTIDKTVVGSINEVNDKADDLSDVVSGETKTIDYTSVITVDDALPVNADVTAKIEPIQDLHGYDKPWVGGAGKNKLPMTVESIKAANTTGTWSGNDYTINGVTFAVLTDNDGNVTGIKLNGIASATVQFQITGDVLDSSFTGMILNGCPAGGSLTTYRLLCLESGTSNAIDTGSGVTIGSISNIALVQIRISNGTNMSGKIFYPMIRLATETDATFAPYTNICPISGHTEAVVTRTGENVAFNTISGKNINASGVIINADFDLKVAKVTSGVTYTAYTDDSNSVYAFYSANPASGSASYNNSRTEATVSNSCFEFTAPIDGYIAYRTNVGYDRTECAESSSIQQYTLALGDTIYGGTVDFDSGVMTVDRAFVEFDGSEDEVWQDQYGLKLKSISNALYSAGTITCFSNEFKTFIDTVAWADLLASDNIATITKDGNIIKLGVVYKATADLTEFKAFLANSPLQFCYELATPTTIQLTPQQIQLLKGTNTIYADSGDIKLTYETGLEESISDVQEQVNDVHSGFTDAIGWDRNVNIFNKSTAVYNKTVGSDGAEKADTGYFCSDYIPITPNTTYYLTKVFGVNWANAGCIYDSTKTFIRKFTISDPSGAASSGAYTVSDSNAAFMRINGDLTKIGEVQVEKGSIATVYEPYHPVIGPAVETLLSRVPKPPTTSIYEHFLCADGAWEYAEPPMSLVNSKSGNYRSRYGYFRYGRLVMLWIDGITTSTTNQEISICTLDSIFVVGNPVVYGTGVYNGSLPPTSSNVAYFYIDDNQTVKAYPEKEFSRGRAYLILVDVSPD